MRTKKIYCPINGWDCPYYKHEECGMEDPMAYCEEFGVLWEVDDDYFSEEDRTVFECDCY